MIQVAHGLLGLATFSASCFCYFVVENLLAAYCGALTFWRLRFWVAKEIGLLTVIFPLFFLYLALIHFLGASNILSRCLQISASDTALSIIIFIWLSFSLISVPGTGLALTADPLGRMPSVHDGTLAAFFRRVFGRRVQRNRWGKGRGYAPKEALARREAVERKAIALAGLLLETGMVDCIRLASPRIKTECRRRELGERILASLPDVSLTSYRRPLSPLARTVFRWQYGTWSTASVGFVICRA